MSHYTVEISLGRIRFIPLWLAEKVKAAQAEGKKNHEYWQWVREQHIEAHAYIVQAYKRLGLDREKDELPKGWNYWTDEEQEAAMLQAEAARKDV